MASPSLIIPGLPDDLALRCLAWLPRRLEPLASCVSRAWRNAFHSHALVAIRRRLGIIQENRLFLCLKGDGQRSRSTLSCCLLDPSLCPQFDNVPSPSFSRVGARDYDAMMGQDEVLLVAQADYPPSPYMSFEQEMGRLDVLRGSWRSHSPPEMQTFRNSFASAYLDGYIYVAGGRAWINFLNISDVFSNGLRVRPLKSVERLECSTMYSWERLPDMQVARVGAKAVILNGCLCVIGGYDEGRNAISSGEMWDERSQTWVLLPEMWPPHIFSGYIGCPRNVADLMGTLFAIKQEDDLQKGELMAYNAACKSWTSLGKIPFDSFHEGAVSVSQFFLFGVGKELWLMVEGDEAFNDMFIIACSPLNSTPSTLLWRLLPYSFHGFKLYSGLAVTLL